MKLGKLLTSIRHLLFWCNAHKVIRLFSQHVGLVPLVDFRLFLLVGMLSLPTSEDNKQYDLENPVLGSYRKFRKTSLTRASRTPKMAPITDPILLPPSVLPPGIPLCAAGELCTGVGTGSGLVVAGGLRDVLAGGGTIPALQPCLGSTTKEISSEFSEGFRDCYPKHATPAPQTEKASKARPFPSSKLVMVSRCSPCARPPARNIACCPEKIVREAFATEAPAESTATENIPIDGPVTPSTRIAVPGVCECVSLSYGSDQYAISDLPVKYVVATAARVAV